MSTNPLSSPSSRRRRFASVAFCGEQMFAICEKGRLWYYSPSQGSWGEDSLLPEIEDPVRPAAHFRGATEMVATDAELPQPEPTIWMAINAIADRLAALEAAANSQPAPNDSQIGSSTPDHFRGVAEMVATDGDPTQPPAPVERLLYALTSISVYGRDTLSEPENGSANFSWYCSGIREMVQRADAAVIGFAGMALPPAENHSPDTTP